MVADAVRFVSAGVGGGSGLYYVHADHLGTPQKMTDGNQALVWDAVFKPFGEAHRLRGRLQIIRGSRDNMPIAKRDSITIIFGIMIHD